MHHNLMKKNQKMLTCNRSVLETLGCWPIVLNISPDIGYGIHAYVLGPHMNEHNLLNDIML
jgi:hypothetical protein